MIIQYASDLHLEFPLNYRFVMAGGIQPRGDCLVLAGDIANLELLDRYNDFWDWCSDHFERTIFVLGNHDYYGMWLDVKSAASPFVHPIRSNVVCCNNTVVPIGDIRFICSTLWSKINPLNAVAIQNTLLDFSCIRLGQRQISIDDYQQLHEQSITFVKKAVSESQSQKIIVVTHHLPSYCLIADCFKNSPLNSGFATELGDWIADNPINYWIFGHSHADVEGTIGQTQFLSNQLGYLELGEGKTFSPAKVIKL